MAFIKELIHRRIPHIIGSYLIAGTSLILFVDWLVNRYTLPEYYTTLCLFGVIAIMPSVVILAYFHGAPGQDEWTKIEKIGVPINITFIFLVLFIGHKSNWWSKVSNIENNNKYEKANILYEKIKPLSNFYWHSKLKKARNLELLGDNKKSILILEEMSNEKKDRYDSLKLLGDIYRNYDKYDEAIKIYNEAILRIKKIGSEHWDLLYSRGVAYERNNQWILAEKDFLKILELRPDQPDVLNYLGYSWIEKDINLDQAKKFILKAVNLKPRDPYIVDSLGWAYYNLKEYDKAVEELERAITLKPTDPIINDHLGDAYLKVNRELEALYQWKKAIQFNSEEDLRIKIEEKIKKLNANNELDLL